MADHCPRVVANRDGVVVDLFGANIGKVPVNCLIASELKGKVNLN